MDNNRARALHRHVVSPASVAVHGPDPSLLQGCLQGDDDFAQISIGCLRGPKHIEGRGSGLFTQFRSFRCPPVFAHVGPAFNGDATGHPKVTFGGELANIEDFSVGFRVSHEHVGSEQRRSWVPNLMSLAM